MFSVFCASVCETIKLHHDIDNFMSKIGHNNRYIDELIQTCGTTENNTVESCVNRIKNLQEEINELKIQLNIHRENIKSSIQDHKDQYKVIRELIPNSCDDMILKKICDHKYKRLGDIMCYYTD